MIKETAEAVNSEIPLEIPSDEVIRNVLKRNLGFEKIFSDLFPDPETYFGDQPLSGIILARYREKAQSLPYLAFPNGPATITELKQQGFVQGIVTNRIRMAKERLEQGKYPELEFLLSPRNKEDRKPSPQAFQEALLFLKVKDIDRTEVLSVGDHPDDYQASKEAGLNFVAVVSGSTTREEFLELGLDDNQIIDDISELKRMLL